MEFNDLNTTSYGVYLYLDLENVNKLNNWTIRQKLSIYIFLIAC